MDRRQFLRGVAAAGAASVVSGNLRWPAQSAPQGDFGTSVLDAPASACPVDTIVILMMENRSFDHYFGWLADDVRYLEAGRSRYGRRFDVNGRTDVSYRDSKTGKLVRTYHLPTRRSEENPYRGCGHPDPGHGPVQGRAQRDHGFLARNSGNDAFALGYYLGDDLPLYGPIARNFTVFDRYHCSLLSSTYPNRIYLQAAQTNGDMDPPLPIQELGFHYPCIWDGLRAAEVSCGNYATDLPSSLFFGPRSLPMIRPIADFFVDAEAGTLPNVVLVDPSYTSGFRMDDHPLGDMRVAQKFASNIVRALQSSPQWQRTAMFITYDEWGGFFDHVRPPLLADDRPSRVDLKNFSQAGFRVPTMLVSPFARPGFVDHRLYDHASILRFLEWRFLGAPAEGSGGHGWWLTARDRRANNIGVSLQPHVQTDMVFSPLPEVPLESAPCQGYWFQDVPVLDQPDRDGALKPFGLSWIGAEMWLDRIGYETKPGMTMRELLNP